MQHMLKEDARAPEQGDEEAAHLGDTDPYEPVGSRPRLFLKAARAEALAAGLAKSLARVTARSACAVMAKVMCRCHPTQLRTSY
jgi:hypothetical protein